MQLTPRYLVKNRTIVIPNEVGFVTEYKPVYQRELQVYRGIDNALEFQVLNADQKPVPLTGKHLEFVAFDEKQNLVIKHRAEILIANKGLAKVTITDNDLLNISQQYLHYNLYIINEDDSRSLTYTDEHFNANAAIYVSSQAFPGPKESIEITKFNSPTGSASNWTSDAITAEPGINGNEAVHTAAIYSKNFVGKITVEATLENQLSGDSTITWSTVETVEFDGSEFGPTPINFYGVFSYIRFSIDTDPTDRIEKILIRN